MSVNDPKEAAAHLLAYLRQLKNDRGAMADLRCALNPTKLFRAWPLLARVGGIDNPRIGTIAGLFAYHPDETQTGNLGTTCRHLAAENKYRFRTTEGMQWHRSPAVSGRGFEACS